MIQTEIDLNVLYQICAASPLTFKRVFRNLLFHELLVIQEATQDAIDVISELSYDEGRSPTESPIFTVKNNLEKLEPVYFTALCLTEYFREETICGSYAGEDARVRIGGVAKKAKTIVDCFYEKLKEGVDVNLPYSEQHKQEEKNFPSAKAETLELLQANLKDLGEIERLYSCCGRV